MRVFVTGTGRCGTSTFYQACLHLTTYTCGHESAALNIFLPDYPDHHIEISAQLMASIGILRDRYPVSKWVHLIREQSACIASIAREQKPLNRYFRHWRQCEIPEGFYAMAATEFYREMNANIACLLPEDRMTFRLEEAQDNWPVFCRWIGAQVSVEESSAEWNRRYNSTAARGRDNFIEATA